ncbi:hypothetical protein WICPIJ_008279 [Wickerhamomyces pijperi]|uniref:Uncharacterized protein n=1 Tax=Wickerhamomyces pijperi TaxID=599730 RepID=A0A9P8TJ15_WICPI|nr:hypothetical protein WICPIJ_008279 [Wickerhamomyces pijperi]
MLNARTIQSVLSQSLNPVSTTKHSILATGVTLPNGTMLTSIVNKNKTDNQVNEVMVKVYALNLSKVSDNVNELTKFEVIPETHDYEEDGETEEDSILTSSNTGIQTLQQSTGNYHNPRYSNYNNHSQINSSKTNNGKENSSINESTQGFKLFVQKIPNTAYLIILFTDLMYPEGLVKLKMASLVENLKELEGLQQLY